MPWADLSDVRCYYETPGQGEPLLLVPGLGGTCRVWDPVLPELARHFTLILVDNRGVGRSEPKRHARSLADLASDLVELLDALQLDRAHVMGVSLGGIIAQRLAVDHPSRVDRLVLVSCTDRFSPYLTHMAGLLAQTLRHLPRDAYHRTMELLGTAPEYLDEHLPEIEQRVREKCRSGASPRAVGRQLRCLACSEIDSRHYRIAAPTLVLAGEFDAIIPRCYAKRMADKIPGSTLVTVPGASHNPLADHPERALPHVVSFLKRERLINSDFDYSTAPTEFGAWTRDAREALLMR